MWPMDEISPIFCPAGGKLARAETAANLEARVPGCTAAADRKAMETLAPATKTHATSTVSRCLRWGGLGAGLVTGASDAIPPGSRPTVKSEHSSDMRSGG